MISVLITLLVLCLVIWWIISLIPLPAPFAQVARVCIAVIFLIVVLYELLPLAHIRM